MISHGQDELPDELPDNDGMPLYGIYKDASMALSSKLPLQKLTAVVSPQKQKSSLLNYWTSISVVCTLLSGMSASMFFSPPSMNLGTDTFAALSGISFALVFCCVIMSVIYFAILNQLPSDVAVVHFIEKYSKVLPLPTTLFVLGSSMHVITFIYGGFVLYGANWATFTASAVLLSIFLAILCVWISMQKFSVDEVNAEIGKKANRILRAQYAQERAAKAKAQGLGGGNGDASLNPMQYSDSSGAGVEMNGMGGPGWSAQAAATIGTVSSTH